MKDKIEKEDSKISTTARDSGDTTQEDETSFRTSLQLVPAVFKKLKNQSFDAEIAAVVESVTYDVCDHSTAEELVMSDNFIDGQDGSCVGSRDVIFRLVEMKLEEPFCKKNSSLNLESQLLHSGERNLEAHFPYAECDGIPKSKQTVQSKVSTAEEILFQKCSTSESDCEVLHVQKAEFGDDKSGSPSRESDLGLKFQKDGKNDCLFDSGENVVAVHLETSKQDNEWKQSSVFEVKKAIDTDRNQLTISLSSQEETVKYRREVSCSSSSNMLRGVTIREVWTWSTLSCAPCCLESKESVGKRSGTN